MRPAASKQRHDVDKLLQCHGSAESGLRPAAGGIFFPEMEGEGGTGRREGGGGQQECGSHWLRRTDEASSSVSTTVLLYYLYVGLSSPNEACEEQLAWGADLNLNGRIRVSTEGINGTLDGDATSVQEYMRRMDAKFSQQQIDWKLGTYPPECLRRFKGLVCKVTKEIISTDLDPAALERVVRAGPGPHLTPEEWHQIITRDPPGNLCLIDARNYYETRIGRFEWTATSGAGGNETRMLPLDPFTRQFSDFFRVFKDGGEQLEQLRGKKILMYCTGGVRCERASAFLRAQGLLDVSQLSGGIHAYLETYGDDAACCFKGANFVYDSRIAVRGGSSSQTVVGKCCVCSCKHDDYTFQLRCSACRVLVLVCPDCATKDARELELECEMCTKG